MKEILNPEDLIHPDIYFFIDKEERKRLVHVLSQPLEVTRSIKGEVTERILTIVKEELGEVPSELFHIDFRDRKACKAFLKKLGLSDHALSRILSLADYPPIRRSGLSVESPSKPRVVEGRTALSYRLANLELSENFFRSFLRRGWIGSSFLPTLYRVLPDLKPSKIKKGVAGREVQVSFPITEYDTSHMLAVALFLAPKLPRRIVESRIPYIAIDLLELRCIHYRWLSRRYLSFPSLLFLTPHFLGLKGSVEDVIYAILEEASKQFKAFFLSHILSFLGKPCGRTIRVPTTVPLLVELGRSIGAEPYILGRHYHFSHYDISNDIVLRRLLSITRLAR